MKEMQTAISLVVSGVNRTAAIADDSVSMYDLFSG